MIEINNVSKRYKKIDEDFLKKIVKKVLKGEGVDLKQDISVAIVDSEEIKGLNKNYRKKNKATDVLSFGKVGDEISEIVICPEEVLKNGSDFEKELALVLIHGVLHLLGYDHEKKESEAKKMFNKQEEYLSRVKF